jgi:DNA replication protein DnaC
MLNTAEVLSKMGDFETGNEWLENVMRYQLVVLDDLGAERQTEYAMEMLFRFVDARYRSRRPMLCTTNLTLVDLRNPSDLVHGRIFDRVLEMTVPVGFGSDSRRKELGAEKFAQAKKFLTG